jgi:hypothetical protein
VPSSNRLLDIYLTLAQYPILSDAIRVRMREELYTRGITTLQALENEVRAQAIRSQELEGLHNPLMEEQRETWELRLSRMRDHHTDLVFSQRLPFSTFEDLVNEVLNKQGISVTDMMLSLNPELAPQDMVFQQAMTIDNMPPEQRAPFEARLHETKVVLIRNLVSDQLRYINVAKEFLTLNDLSEIRRRKIGAGRIGGKAGGMLLAWRVLRTLGDTELRSSLNIPESYYLGSDEIYTFMATNLVHWNDQKYKLEEEMRRDYPQILEDFQQGKFLPHILDRLQGLLAAVGQQPVIVRSSSLLEDNFGTSFAGKYDSVFVPNQGSLEENLNDLTRAIAAVYASTLNPNALLYRRSRGLQDYDERMAILIQVVQGDRLGKYYLPHAAGVAFGHNLYRWAPQIRKEDGFIRLVWGMGTRAVDRVGNDYPRLIALSHPSLRPSTAPKNIRRYSQHYVDLIDMEDNTFKTLPVHEVLSARYAPLRYLAQSEEEGDFISLRSSLAGDIRQLVLTFDDLLRRTPFADRMRQILKILENNYHAPVDMEFALMIENADTGQPRLKISILQCRPQAQLAAAEEGALPYSLLPQDVIFSTTFVVPRGHIRRVDYVIYIPPEGYFALSSENERNKLARTLGKLNAAMKGQEFIFVGPGRWGSSNTDLGVPIAYGDIYNARSLVELAGPGIGPEPEPSLGTHFFQDLLETQIYPLAILLDDKKTIFNQNFFTKMPNRLAAWLGETEMESALHLIRVSDYRPDHHIRIVMDDEKGQAIAFLEEDLDDNQ